MGARLNVFVIGAGVVLLTTSCAMTDDPHEGGFCEGVVNLVSGRYTRRIEEKEKILEQEVSKEQRLKKRAEQVRREREQLRAELEKSNQRLIALEDSIRQKRAALEGDRKKTLEAEEELRKAEAQLASVKEKLERTQEEEEDRPVEDLKELSRDIQTDLDELDTLVELLGRR